jgi:hypothetical protein
MFHEFVYLGVVFSLPRHDLSYFGVDKERSRSFLFAGSRFVCFILIPEPDRGTVYAF